MESQKEGSVINHPVTIDMQITTARNSVIELFIKLHDTCRKQDALIISYDVDTNKFLEAVESNKALIAACNIIELQKNVLIRNIQQGELHLEQLEKKSEELKGNDNNATK